MDAAETSILLAAPLYAGWRFFKYVRPGPLRWTQGLQNKAVARLSAKIFKSYGVDVKEEGDATFDLSLPRAQFHARLPTFLIACRDRSFFGSPEIFFADLASVTWRLHGGARPLVLMPSEITRDILWYSDQNGIPVLHTSDIPKFARELRLARAENWQGYTGDSAVLTSLLKIPENSRAAQPPQPKPADQPPQDEKRLETLRHLRREAEEAERSGNLQEAREHWCALKNLAPDDFGGPFHEARVLTQLGENQAADEVLAKAAGRFPKQQTLLAAYARSATQLGNAAEAVARWQAVLEAAPTWGAAQVQYAIALNAAGRFDAADAALLAATKVVPDPWDVLVQHARNAASRNDRDEAVRRWRSLAETFPNKPAAYIGLAEALRVNRQAAEAVLAVDAGLANLPDDNGLLAEKAKNLFAAGRLDEAVEIWAHLRANSPLKVGAFTEPAAMLRLSGRLDASAALIDEGLRHFPGDLGLLGERASVRARLQDWQGALDIWTSIDAARPGQRTVLFGIAEALVELGRPAEAIQILDRMLSQTPEHKAFLLVRAKADMALGLWPPAIARLEHLSSLDPRNHVVMKLLYQARLAAMEAGPTAETADEQHEPHAERAIIVPRQAAETDDADKQLLNRFESLGDDCEFGLVQRYYGTEPLGLLRWTAISPQQLTAALRAEFAGVGEAENTTLSTGGAEYVTRDRNFLMTMHTWIETDTIGPEAVLPKLLIRLKFLKRKLLEDLKTAEKIFIYKAKSNVTDEEIESIYEALQSYGPAKIVFVRQSGDPELIGRAKQILPNAYIGHVRRFGLTGEGKWDIDFQSWLNVCKAVEGLLS